MQAWLGLRLRRGSDDAADLAQEAFAFLLQSRFFDRADPARGSFRGLLKTALRHFAIDRLRQANAERRGGGRAPVSIDADNEPVDAEGRSPDQLLDDAWRKELLQNAHAELQRDLEANGRATHWALFRDYYLADDDAIDHAALAARHGITRTDVTNWLQFGKQRYRAILRRLVLDTVADADELERELQWLFGPARRDRGPS